MMGKIYDFIMSMDWTELSCLISTVIICIAIAVRVRQFLHVREEGVELVERASSTSLATADRDALDSIQDLLNMPPEEGNYSEDGAEDNEGSSWSEGSAWRSSSVSSFFSTLCEDLCEDDDDDDD